MGDTQRRPLQHIVDLPPLARQLLATPSRKLALQQMLAISIPELDAQTLKLACRCPNPRDLPRFLLRRLTKYADFPMILP
jgi:hypothetical protein